VARYRLQVPVVFRAKDKVPTKPVVDAVKRST
jgi:hypothetical protein